MFSGDESFNQDISGWNTASVNDMSGMFQSSRFNQDISSWDVSQVTDMERMFAGTFTFNQDISVWNTSSVTNMSQMFAGAVEFNQNLNPWNVSKVSNMNGMFADAYNFKQNLLQWNVSSVTDMSEMFSACIYQYYYGDWECNDQADPFGGDISMWDISNVETMESMFLRNGLSTEHYDSLLSSWSILNVKSDVLFNAGSSQYSTEQQMAKDALTQGYNWIINDGGKVTQ